MTQLFRALVMTGAALTAACQQQELKTGGTDALAPAATMPVGVAAATAAEVPAEELRMALADFQRAHQQKGMLTTWVSLPLVRPPVNAAVRPFYRRMGERQGELLQQLRAWARDRGMDLTHRPETDLDGRAMAIMEARQEKMVRASGAGDFDRDMLMQMYHDYEWQICVIQALMPAVRDAGLRAYLERSLRVHEEGSAEIVGLLRRFKFSG